MKALVILVVVAGLVLVSGACWCYAINTWLVFLGNDAVLKLWQGCLIGLVPAFGQLSIPVAVITWILMLFLA